MPTWDEANKAYTEAIMEEFELGKQLGFIDGALYAYQDVLTAMTMEPVTTFDNLKNLVQNSVNNYKALNEELEDVD